jgi:2-polyprenyl-3-methyl-5-hydroxy-6-metoxy-1,4-benzoquinol methylase
MKDEYREYQGWKRWQEFGMPSSSQARYFARELAILGPLRGRRILEIGFGNGVLLRFAKDGGAEVLGTEIIPELLKAAAEAGFQVGRTTELFADKRQAGSFDAVEACAEHGYNKPCQLEIFL